MNQKFFSSLKVLPQALLLLRQAAPKHFLISVFGSVSQGFVPAISSVLFKLIIDRLIEKKGFSEGIIWLLIAQFLLLITSQFLNAMTEYSRNSVRELLGNHLRIKVANHAASLDLEFFEKPQNYDSFSKANRELGYRPFLMAFAIIFICEGIANVVGFFVAVFIFQPFLAFALVVAAIPVFFAVNKSGSETYSNFDLMTSDSRRAGYFEMLLTGERSAKELRLFNLTPRLLQELQTFGNNQVTKVMKLQKNRQTRYFFTESISLFTQFGAVIFVTYEVVNGRASIGDFSLLTSAIANVRGGLIRVLTNLGDLTENSLFFSDLTDFLQIKPRITAPPNPRQIPFYPLKSLALKNITFSYPGSEKLIFNDFNLELNASEATALVGVNGTGKTTIVKLLTRLYDPQKGSVTYDGIDIREFDPIDYRSRLSVILQDFAQYQLSARENISLDLTQSLQSSEIAKLEKAARGAGALELIQGLPDAWETLLGKQFHVRGQDLSGGQWQRIALARALYRDSPILILDEPTAALDAEAELELFTQYKELTKGKLSLLISHRFNTLKMADRIVVLENGCIIEDGSHADLIRLNGRYAEMFEAQASTYQV